MNYTSANYYLRLGVGRTATPDEVRRAFRSLARIYHPDVANNKTFAEEVFKRLNEAYETLSDNTKRRHYDLELVRLTGAIPTVNPFAPPSPPRPSPSPRPPSPHATGPMPRPTRPSGFNATPPPPSAAQRPSPPPTAAPEPKHRADLDIESHLEIMLEDAVQGATYVITVQQNDQVARRQNLHTCRVQVPAQVYEGQRLRLKGLGFVDTQSFYLGDLYLTIRYAKHKRFRAHSCNLFGEVTISPWEAALGTRVRFPTLDGLADLHVPAGAQPGTRLRLANYGLPKSEGGRGDLYLAVAIRVPVATTEKERELWRALANQHNAMRR